MSQNNVPHIHVQLSFYGGGHVATILADHTYQLGQSRISNSEAEAIAGAITHFYKRLVDENTFGATIFPQQLEERWEKAWAKPQASTEHPQFTTEELQLFRRLLAQEEKRSEYHSPAMAGVVNLFQTMVAKIDTIIGKPPSPPSTERKLHFQVWGLFDGKDILIRLDAKGAERITAIEDCGGKLLADWPDTYESHALWRFANDPDFKAAIKTLF